LAQPEAYQADPARLAELEACLYRLAAIVDLLVDNQQVVADRVSRRRGAKQVPAPSRPPLRLVQGGAP
jgi:hypothetical protein